MAASSVSRFCSMWEDDVELQKIVNYFRAPVPKDMILWLNFNTRPEENSGSKRAAEILLTSAIPKTVLERQSIQPVEGCHPPDFNLLNCIEAMVNTRSAFVQKTNINEVFDNLTNKIRREALIKQKKLRCGTSTQCPLNQQIQAAPRALAALPSANGSRPIQQRLAPYLHRSSSRCYRRQLQPKKAEQQLWPQQQAPNSQPCRVVPSRGSTPSLQMHPITHFRPSQPNAPAFPGYQQSTPSPPPYRGNHLIINSAPPRPPPPQYCVPKKCELQRHIDDQELLKMINAVCADPRSKDEAISKLSNLDFDQVGNG